MNLPDRDDYIAYEEWAAANTPDPPKWRCEYCHRRGEGEPPMRSEAGFDACCESHAACLDYMDIAEANYKADWRDTMIAVGLLLCLLVIAIWGDLQ